MNDEQNGDEPNGVSRRRFLGQASCAAVGTTAIFSTVLDMSMINVLAQTTPGDYRAMVCLFFGGGIDSFNVVVPRGQAEYDEYAQVRRDLALPQDVLLPITPVTPDGREYGLHPNVPELQALFGQGDL
ncbi:MAG TPA: twin-arginine translocation signal domain-containing protein, partial [Candidatus Polarisedimenticolaceae bacterium]|nr:twin-arginine translocation signal domain-containing protein [Candidatus Polarisedimenticolaceae bacterium]